MKQSLTNAYQAASESAQTALQEFRKVANPADMRVAYTAALFAFGVISFASQPPHIPIAPATIGQILLVITLLHYASSCWRQSVVNRQTQQQVEQAIQLALNGEDRQIPSPTINTSTWYGLARSQGFHHCVLKYKNLSSLKLNSYL